MIRIENMSAAWVYTFGSRGRSLPIDGPTIVVEAASMRDAIKLARARLTNAWSLVLKSVARKS